MKKKLLVIMLVVLLVASMVVTVFACNGGKKEPTKKPPVTNNTPPDDEIGIGDALTAVLGGVDKTLYDVVGNTGKESYYAATIFVDALIADEGATKPTIDLGVEVDIKASLAQGDADNSAALIEVKDKGKVLVSLYAKGEVFYIGQQVAKGAEEMTWVKLQQVDGANLINGKLAGMLFGALNDLQKAEREYKKDEEGNYLDKDGKITTDKSKYVEANAILSDFEITKKGGFLGKKIGSVMTIVGAVSTLFDVQENKTDAGTDYDISLLIEEIANLEIGGLLPMIGVQLDEDGGIKGLDKSLAGIIDVVCQYVLGQSLTDMLAGKEATGDVPEIKIAGGLNNDGSLKNFGLSYEYTLAIEDPETEEINKTEVAIALGLKNVKVAQAANVDFAPSDAGWDKAQDVALNATMNIAAPGQNIDADIKLVLYPAVDMTFADEYVNLDFANVAGYVQVKNNKDATPAFATVATIDQATAGQKGFKINFTKALAALGIDTTGLETDFFIPCDLTTIVNTAIRAPKKEAVAPASAAATTPETISGINTIANSIYALVKSGAFNIGAITGLIGPVMDVIPALGDTIAAVGSVDEETGVATLDVEKVMAEAIAIIAGLDLTKELTFNGVGSDGQYAEKALSAWLANGEVFYGIAGIVNTIIYDNDEALRTKYATFEAYAKSEDAFTAETAVALVNTVLGQEDAFATNDLYAGLTITASGAGDIANNGASATVAINKNTVELVSVGISFSLAGENKPTTGADGGFAYADGTVLDSSTPEGLAALDDILEAMASRFLAAE
ncbi:MAG: hypothetical protein IKM01_00885 [Clostridia bacterium]|nr:hypothetical protein [Clostridia bacterium]